MTPENPPDALLLIVPACPHCPAVLDALASLVKQGAIGRLEVANIALRPDMAAAAGTRSVPWIRIGDLELEGLHTSAELAGWVRRAARPEGYREYLRELLENGKLERVTRALRKAPARIVDLVALLGAGDTPLSARIGSVAVFEDLQGEAILGAALPSLAGLLQAQSPRVRADACHCLGMVDDPRVTDLVTPLLRDPDPEVREIALETRGPGDARPVDGGP